MTAPAWSTARALAALLRACATEAERSPREGEGETGWRPPALAFDTVTNGLGSVGDFENLDEHRMRHLLKYGLRLPTVDVYRIIASVYAEPDAPAPFRVNAPRWEHRVLTDPIAMSLHHMGATDAEAAATYALALAQLQDDFKRYVANDARPLVVVPE